MVSNAFQPRELVNAHGGLHPLLFVQRRSIMQSPSLSRTFKSCALRPSGFSFVGPWSAPRNPCIFYTRLSSSPPLLPHCHPLAQLLFSVWKARLMFRLCLNRDTGPVFFPPRLFLIFDEATFEEIVRVYVCVCVCMLCNYVAANWLSLRGKMCVVKSFISITILFYRRVEWKSSFISRVTLSFKRLLTIWKMYQIIKVCT